KKRLAKILRPLLENVLSLFQRHAREIGKALRGADQSVEEREDQGKRRIHDVPITLHLLHHVNRRGKRLGAISIWIEDVGRKECQISNIEHDQRKKNREDDQANPPEVSAREHPRMPDPQTLLCNDHRREQENLTRDERQQSRIHQYCRDRTGEACYRRCRFGWRCTFANTSPADGKDSADQSANHGSHDHDGKRDQGDDEGSKYQPPERLSERKRKGRYFGLEAQSVRQNDRELHHE